MPSGGPELQPRGHQPIGNPVLWPWHPLEVVGFTFALAPFEKGVRITEDGMLL